MVLHEGGRWDVGTKNNSVHVERISESDDRLFEDLLSPDVARNLAGLLTKYANKLDDKDDSDDEDDDSRESENSKDSGTESN